MGGWNGGSSSETEIVVLAPSAMVTCSAVADLPYNVHDTSAVKYNDLPVFCGGNT